jgi:hypothetical protein
LIVPVKDSSSQTVNASVDGTWFDVKPLDIKIP